MCHSSEWLFNKLLKVSHLPELRLETKATSTRLFGLALILKGGRVLSSSPYGIVALSCTFYTHPLAFLQSFLNLIYYSLLGKITANLRMLPCGWENLALSLSCPHYLVFFYMPIQVYWLIIWNHFLCCSPPKQESLPPEKQQGLQKSAKKW